MRWIAAVTLFLAACNFQRGGSAGGVDGGDDAIDTPPTVCASSFSALVDTCTATFGPAVTLPAGPEEYRYDTDTHELERCFSSIAPGGGCMTMTAPPFTDVHGMEVWLVEAFTLAADTHLVVDGSRPFAIVAAGAVTIAGSIEVQAGARTVVQCGESAGKNGNDNGSGGGGGGGGGFQRPGQVGGTGGANGGNGGATQTIPDVLIGGCPGGDGGGGPNGGPVGALGGGAIHVAAKTEIQILSNGGRINAGGRGGRGADSDSGGAGGSGGGSGGMIWLQAPTIQIAGALAANGGGGGEGTSGSNDGQPGSRGGPSAIAASGGGGRDSNGGDGGDGDAGAVSTATAGEARNSGGGAGGGVGYIRIVGTRGGGGIITPPPL
jgi:hypothetical protein